MYRQPGKSFIMMPSPTKTGFSNSFFSAFKISLLFFYWFIIPVVAEETAYINPLLSVSILRILSSLVSGVIGKINLRSFFKVCLAGRFQIHTWADQAK